MAAIESKNLVVALKAFSRGNALPLDSKEVWDSYAEAEAYAGSVTAYAGQTIKVLVDGKYKSYVLQPSDAGYVLEEVGAVKASDIKQYVQVVPTLPTSNQEQGVIYIEEVNYTGSVWTGDGWKVVFESVQTQLDAITERLDSVEGTLDEKAPVANPVFTGTVTLAVDPTEDLHAATKQYVDRLINNLVSSVPGVVDSANALPSADYKAGQTWRVAEAGTYAGHVCEAGDLIICLKDFADATAESDFMVVQSNISGAVTSSVDASTDGNIVVFDGITGKIIKDSAVSVASLNDAIAKAHEHANKEVLDSYDKSQTELLEAAKAEAQGLVDVLAETVNGKADKATTLAGYGIEDAYTTTQVDNLLKPITDNLNTKVDATTVDSKINEAKTEVTEGYTTLIGDIGESATVAEYVDMVVGSGGADVAEQLDQVLATSKKYTDDQIAAALTVQTF